MLAIGGGGGGRATLLRVRAALNSGSGVTVTERKCSLDPEGGGSPDV